MTVSTIHPSAVILYSFSVDLGGIKSVALRSDQIRNIL